MSTHHQNQNASEPNARIKQLLQEALPSINAHQQPGRDLWPDLLRRLAAQPAAQLRSLPWFDWALVAGLVAFAAFFPATIPVVLYYL